MRGAARRVLDAVTAVQVISLASTLITVLGVTWLLLGPHGSRDDDDAAEP